LFLNKKKSVADRARRCQYQVDEGRFAISAAENNCGLLAEGERETLLVNTRLELKVKKLEEENLALRDELATECVERYYIYIALITHTRCCVL